MTGSDAAEQLATARTVLATADAHAEELHRALACQPADRQGDAACSWTGTGSPASRPSIGCAT